MVPTRNAGAYLATALAGVVGQEPPPDDVVVVDAASTDDTLAVAARFAGVRAVDQQGAGLGHARNQGIAEVDGEVVAFCDADDRWPEGSLAARLCHLREHPGCDAVIGHAVLEAPPGAEVPERVRPRLGMPQPGYTPGALAVRRPALAAVGPFDEALRIGSDSAWFVRLVQSDRSLAVLDDVVLVKGMRGDSLSADIEDYRRELLVVAREYVRRERAGGPPTNG